MVILTIWVEHIVHIDGVTGSSPVSTTTVLGQQRPRIFIFSVRGKEVSPVPKFIPREKLGNKARRALDAEKRATWSFSPVTRKVENKKHYDRKKSARVWKDDFGMSAFCLP